VNLPILNVSTSIITPMDGATNTRSSRLLITLAFVAFISLGLPDTILGVGWPFIRATFGRPIDSLAFLLTCGMGGYLTSSFFSGTIIRFIGVGKILLISSALVCVALTGNVFAPGFWWIAGFSFVSGLGAGAIDGGINTFAAKHFSSRVVNWLHASWGIGATIGPAMMTAIITANLSWRIGYAILAGAMGILSVLFLLTMPLWKDGAPAEPDHAIGHASIGEALSMPMVWLQSLLFFVYCAIEATAGQLLFSLFTENRGMTVGIAGSSIAGYWGALTLGRIVFGQLATVLSHSTILRTGMGLAIFAATLVAWAPWPGMGIFGTVLLGLGLAPIFPTLISDTPARVGQRCAAQSVGFQVSAAAVGIAMGPSITSTFARRVGLESVCMVLIFASIALFCLNEGISRRAIRDPQ
jgi:fucose permease